jgi:hypothetical protein
VVAPNADNSLPQLQRDLVGTVLLLVSAGALAFAGQPGLAAAFAGVVIVNTLLLFAFGHNPSAVGRPNPAARSDQARDTSHGRPS